MGTRILVTGSRNWSDRNLIIATLKRYDDTHTTLVSGACPTGADLIAEQEAERFGWNIERHPANWDKYGKSAGPRRNQEMVDAGADICLAFPLPDSRGTWDCTRRAIAANIPVIIQGRSA
jgi:hypothetical protein